jgi:amino acid adenylation domain-containing protein
VTGLAEVLRAGVDRNPDGVALREPDGDSIGYRELDALVDRFAAALVGLGVGQGARVAVWLPKSIAAVAAMQAAIRVGAAYVPVDPSSPVARARTVLADCRAAACVTRRDWAESALTGELASVPTLLADWDGPRESWPLPDSEWEPPPRPAGGDDLAYILYTSGSTGRPKGVCISHRNALAFVDWAHAELGATPDDRFANHAGLHFDLSVLDIYVAFRAGATAVLIPERAAFAASRLVELLSAEQVTVWYSVPSVLTLMIERGSLLESPPALRAILFAGEPFPIQYVRRLRATFSSARMLNLYGPTETNVCTFEEVFDVPDARVTPMPIGGACSGNRVWAEREDGAPARVGERGELVVEGPTVMLGYWRAPPHRGPYRTGDVVVRIDEDRYEYSGRRDAMVKVRGNRVELGEVEAALLSHPDVAEAAVTVVGVGMTARLVGFVRCVGDRAPGLLEMKRHCAEQLPPSMIVHRLRQLDELPRTPNGKIDRRALAAAGEETQEP